MRISTRLTMLGLSRTLRALAQAQADEADMPRTEPGDREPPGRRLAARRAKRNRDAGGGDGRQGA
jgi:hypothetical protein